MFGHLAVCILLIGCHASRAKVADLAVRGFDVYSTQVMLANGGHEYFLPDAISHHPAVMAGYGISVVEVQELLPKRFRKVSHWIDAGQDGYWAGQNMFVHGSAGRGSGTHVILCCEHRR